MKRTYLNIIGVLLVIFCWNPTAYAGTITVDGIGAIPDSMVTYTERLPTMVNSDRILSIGGKEYEAFFVDYRYYYQENSGTIDANILYAANGTEIYVIGLEQQGLDYVEISRGSQVVKPNTDITMRLSVSSKYYVNGNAIDALLVLVTRQYDDIDLTIDYFPDYNTSDAQHPYLAELTEGDGIESWNHAYYRMAIETSISLQQNLILDAVQEEVDTMLSNNDLIENASMAVSTVKNLYSLDWSNNDPLGNWKTTLDWADTLGAHVLLNEIYTANNTPAYITEPLDTLIDIAAPALKIAAGIEVADNYADLSLTLLVKCAEVINAWDAVNDLNAILLRVNSLHVAKVILSHQYRESWTEIEIYSYYGLTYGVDSFSDLAKEVSKQRSIVDAGEYTPWSWVLDFDWDNIDTQLVEDTYDIYVTKSQDWKLGRAIAGNLYEDVDGDGVLNPVDSDPNNPLIPESPLRDSETHAPVAQFSTSSTNSQVGTLTTLDGSSSSDPDGDPIVSYQWTLGKPSGSSANIVGTESMTPSFTPDVTGAYVVTLIVSDGELDSKPTSVTFYVSPEPVEGHDLKAHSFVTNSSADPGDTVYFDIVIQNMGNYAENLKIDILVTGPSVSQTIGPVDLGSLSSGYTQTYNNFTSYNFSASAADGYYSFQARVFSDTGDEEWGDNYSATTVNVGMDPQPIKTNAYEYDHKFVPWNENLILPDEYNSGGFGWITYAGYQVAFSPNFNDSKTYVHIKNPSGVTIESHDTIYDGKTYLYDNDRLMVKYDASLSRSNGIAMEVGLAAPNTVTLNPSDGVGMVGEVLSIDIDLGRSGECCFSNDIYEYFPNRNYFLDEVGNDYYNSVIDADGTIKSFGWEMDLVPLVSGVHEFVLQLDGDNDVDYYLFGKLTAYDPPVDSDNDGVIDVADAFPLDVAASVDNDGDSYPDAWNTGKTQADSTTGLKLDLDPTNSLINVDTDGDGLADYYDAFPNDPSEKNDTDNDGVGDNSDAFPIDLAASVDSDGDGYPDSWNTGKDQNDSTADLILDHPLFVNNGSEWADSDGDNVGDNADKFNNDPAAAVDTDNDGYPDYWNSGKTEADSTSGLLIDSFISDSAAAVDTDNDGYPDYWNFGKTEADSTADLTLDMFPNDPTEWADSDFDGVGDNSDWAPNDYTEWVDTDGDGLGDVADVAPSDPSRSTNVAPVLASIAAQSVAPGSSVAIPLIITDEDGDDVIISLLSFPPFVSVNNSEILIVPLEDNTGDYQVLIRVADNYGGITYEHFGITVSSPSKTLVDLTIDGLTTVNEESSAIYTATASWDNGTTSTVNATWSENSDYASINSNGLLSTTTISSNQSVTITASYTADGVTKSDTYAVIIQKVDLVCTYSIAPLSQSFTGWSGQDTITVTTSPGCKWTASTDTDWIVFGVGSNGTGDGIVEYSVSENVTNNSRSTLVSVEGQDVTITQGTTGCTDQYYFDKDEDGYGNPSDDIVYSCTPLLGFVANSLDCNDDDIHINPGVSEICDRIDNNCNGQTDENPECAESDSSFPWTMFLPAIMGQRGETSTPSHKF